MLGHDPLSTLPISTLPTSGSAPPPDSPTKQFRQQQFDLPSDFSAWTIQRKQPPAQAVVADAMYRQQSQRFEPIQEYPLAAYESPQKLLPPSASVVPSRQPSQLSSIRLDPAPTFNYRAPIYTVTASAVAITCITPASPVSGTNDTGTGTFAWIIPGNIVASDNAYASQGVHAGGVSNWLVATFPSDLIPTWATVESLTLGIEHKDGLGGGSITDAAVRLVKNGTIQSDDQASGTAWEAADTVRTYTFSTSGWTASDANTAPGAALSANLGTGVALVDTMTLTICYSGVAPGSVPNRQAQFTDWESFLDRRSPAWATKKTYPQAGAGPASDSPPSKQPSQRFDALPDFAFSWFLPGIKYNFGLPVVFDPPPTRQPSQRFDPLPDYVTTWLRPLMKVNAGVPPQADPPPIRQGSQRFDPLPDFVRTWWIPPRKVNVGAPPVSDPPPPHGGPIWRWESPPLDNLWWPGVREFAPPNEPTKPLRQRGEYAVEPSPLYWFDKPAAIPGTSTVPLRRQAQPYELTAVELSQWKQKGPQSIPLPPKPLIRQVQYADTIPSYTPAYNQQRVKSRPQPHVARPRPQRFDFTATSLAEWFSQQQAFPITYVQPPYIYVDGNFIIAYIAKRSIHVDLPERPIFVQPPERSTRVRIRRPQYAGGN